MKKAVIFDMYGVLVRRRMFLNDAQDPEMAQIVSELKARGVMLLLLSNIYVWQGRRFVRRFPVLRLFDRLYFSNDIALRKPNPHAFRHALDDNGLCASDCIYFDDRRVHVEAAQALGIEAYVFDSPAQVRAILGL